MVVEYSPDFM